MKGGTRYKPRCNFVYFPPAFPKTENRCFKKSAFSSRKAQTQALSSSKARLGPRVRSS